MQFYHAYCARTNLTSKPWNLGMLPYMTKYVIQLSILKGDTYAGSSKQALNALMKGSLRVHTQRSHMERKKHRDHRSRGWSPASSSSEMQAATRSWKRQRVGSALGSHREHSPAHILTRTSGPRTVKDHILVSLCHPG